MLVGHRKETAQASDIIVISIPLDLFDRLHLRRSLRGPNGWRSQTINASWAAARA